VIRHRARFLIVGAGLLAAVAFAVHSAAAPTTAGQSFSWAPAPAASMAPTALGPSGSPHTVPTPHASPSSEPGALGGLRAPLVGLLSRLNAETAATAQGQYSILQEIGNAIRDHIEQFLRWVTGGSRR
jgi:hypothetical protein